MYCVISCQFLLSDVINSYGEEILQYENLDLNTLVTPVKVDNFRKLLIETDYSKSLTDYVCSGFESGFSLEFEGELKGQFTARNLRLQVGSKVELWNKVMAEVRDKRFAGPFENPPFKDFIQSPIGLVPKDKGKKTRLIFHLSHPRSGEYKSVNAGIPRESSSVQYPTFDEAIRLCIEAGTGCSIAKSDFSLAFRNCPIRRKDWALLIMMAEHPCSGKKFYFVDKCLPFGSSISCAIFQKVSDAIAHIVEYVNKKHNINYLDDFMFAA